MPGREDAPLDAENTLPLTGWRGPTRITDDGTVEERYAVRGALGVGGMGEVKLCEDRRSGREVAMKLARDPALHDRFLYEARIQAQLEHPSIVPVYDVGLNAEGAPFFTMKRVHGVTLAQVLKDLRKGDRQTVATHTRRRLLTAFATACMTVHYAHTRNVVHRDLKPSNVMLGEYGELYVLDWGVARADGSSDEATPLSLKIPRKGDDTTPGDVVGTPGFIAPERFLDGTLDARTDVYSLGAILFAILAIEPLHPIPPVDAVRSTLGVVDARPSQRPGGKDIPPELDAICVKATAPSPDDRYQSARDLHDAIDRYLEGDRDLERRRALSVEHARGAERLTQEAEKSTTVADEALLRARAMGEVNTALAFDPSNDDARRALFRLLTVPPHELPPEAKEQLERSRHAQGQTIARGASWLFLSGGVMFGILALTVGFSVRWYAILGELFFGIASLTLWQYGRAPADKGKPGYATLVSTTLAIAWMSGLCGPFFAVPTFSMANYVGFLMQPDRSRRPMILGLTCAALVVPLLLEAVGIVPKSYIFVNGSMVIVNRVIDLTTWGLIGVFGIAGIILTLGVGLFFIRFRDVLSLAEERLTLNAWHLRQLVVPPTDRA